MELLSQLCSTTFMNNLTNYNSVPGFINKIKSIIKNKYDKYIYSYLMHREKFMRNKKPADHRNRIKFWRDNTVRLLNYFVKNIGNKLFMVGYHLQLNISPNTFGNSLKKYKFISLGMASSYMEVKFCSKIFNKKTFNRKMYHKHMYDGTYDYKIMNYFDIYDKSKLEEKIGERYEIINTKTTRGLYIILVQEWRQ